MDRCIDFPMRHAVDILQDTHDRQGYPARHAFVKRLVYNRSKEIDVSLEALLLLMKDLSLRFSELVFKKINFGGKGKLVNLVECTFILLFSISYLVYLSVYFRLVSNTIDILSR